MTFIIFCGEDVCRPRGGANDINSCHETLANALAVISEMRFTCCSWAHIYDMNLNKIVWNLEDEQLKIYNSNFKNLDIKLSKKMY